MAEPEPLLPVFRARLPGGEALLPYLARLDETRQYSNRGVLVGQLEEELNARLCGPGCRAITASSGTAAIQAAILAVAGRATRERPFALVPGYTFVATAMAAEACGYRVLFCDVAADRWCLTPELADAHPQIARCGVVLAVAPYGRALPQAPWQHWQARTAIPVVIDAAASYEALCRDPAALTGTIPVALSFQATKSFSTAEGGAVIWSNYEGLERVAQALNFGFLYSRSSRSAGFNGKMSELHAAMGLACLDGWNDRTRSCETVAAAYKAAAHRHRLAGHILTAPLIASNYALYVGRSARETSEVAARLADGGIEYRFWYGRGVQCEPYFGASDPVHLPATIAVATTLLGIPMFEDLSGPAIERVVSIIASAEAA